MNYFQFNFPVKDENASDILIAMLSEAGFEGFEELEGMLKAFIRESDLDQLALDQICTTLTITYEQSTIQPENWNAKWEQGFEPVRVNDFAAVRASFHEPVTDVQHELIITPKMSFGTGHHATTFLMMAQMSQQNFKGKTVLDFGTGTGVLAILAEKMGAEKITAIDLDTWSIENANENSAANGCSRIEILLSDKIPENSTYDYILANINLNVILSNLSAIVGACKRGSFVMISGFLRTDELELFREVAKQGFICETLTQEGEWVCMGMRIN